MTDVIDIIEAGRAAIDRAIAKLIGGQLVVKAKPVDPLTPKGFDAVVIGMMRELQGAAAPTERKAIDAFLRKVDVDFATMTPEKRSKVIADAGRTYLGIAVDMAPGVRQAVQRNGKVVVESVKGATANRYGLNIDPSFTLVDRKAVEAAATRQAHFVRDVLGTRSVSMSGEARRVVSSGLERGLDRFEIAKELAAAIPEAGRLDSYWQVVASAFVGRSRTISMLSAFDDAGLSTFEFEAVLDEVTTEVCRFMHGKRFDVRSTIERYAEVDAAEDPEDVKRLQPWVYTAKVEGGGTGLVFKDRSGERQMLARVDEPSVGRRDATGQYSNAMSSKAMVAAGITAPPLHGHCRSLIVPVESQVAAAPGPAPSSRVVPPMPVRIAPPVAAPVPPPPAAAPAPVLPPVELDDELVTVEPGEPGRPGEPIPPRPEPAAPPAIVRPAAPAPPAAPAVPDWMRIQQEIDDAIIARARALPSSRINEAYAPIGYVDHGMPSVPRLYYDPRGYFANYPVPYLETRTDERGRRTVQRLHPATIAAAERRGLQMVPLAELHMPTPGIDRSKVIAQVTSDAKVGLVVVKHGGKYYVHRGAEEAVVAKLWGESPNVAAYVVDLDARKPKAPRKPKPEPVVSSDPTDARTRKYDRAYFDSVGVAMESSGNPLQNAKRVFGRDEFPTIGALEATWGDPETGQKIKISSARLTSNEARFSGAILNQQGEKIGRITRTFIRQSNGKLEVHHDLFVISEKKNAGGGGGAAMLRGAIASYEKLGVHFISVDAHWIGRYAWATFGYDWSYRGQKEEHASRFETFLRQQGIESVRARAVAAAAAEHPWLLAGADVDGRKVKVTVDGYYGTEEQTLPLGKAYMLSKVSNWQGVLNIADKESPSYKRAAERLAPGYKKEKR